MTRLRVAARLLEIQRALVRHGLDDFVRATHLYRPFRFLFYLSPWTWFQRSAGATRGERLRLALQHERSHAGQAQFGGQHQTRRSGAGNDHVNDSAHSRRLCAVTGGLPQPPTRALQ